MFTLRMLQGGEDEWVNFEPSVLVFKLLIPDCSFDELRFTLAVISGREVLLSTIGTGTVELYPGCCLR